MASEWRHGRVLLAGDAAHLNNPLGGFGLNSGIHDAVNLAGKLARVWRGEESEALLDVYVQQRRKTTIDQVQAMSIRNKRLLEERDPGGAEGAHGRADGDRRGSAARAPVPARVVDDRRAAPQSGNRQLIKSKSRPAREGKNGFRW